LSWLWSQQELLKNTKNHEPNSFTFRTQDGQFIRKWGLVKIASNILAAHTPRKPKGEPKGNSAKPYKGNSLADPLCAAVCRLAPYARLLKKYLPPVALAVPSPTELSFAQLCFSSIFARISGRSRRRGESRVFLGGCDSKWRNDSLLYFMLFIPAARLLLTDFQAIRKLSPFTEIIR